MIVGVLPDCRKEMMTLEDGYRESADSRGSVRDIRRRGLTAPMLAVGDGNLGLWAALGEVDPETKKQRCWKHKLGDDPLANVLDNLLKRLPARAKELPHEITCAPDRESALEEIALFSEEYAARDPKAIETLAERQYQLLTFLDFLVEQWIHLRTANRTESTFSTVKARAKKTKGAESRKAGLTMAFKLLLAAEKGWRRVNASHLVALVKTGVEFPDGEAEMFHSEPAPADLFTHTPSVFAASEVPIHKI